MSLFKINFPQQNNSLPADEWNADEGEMLYIPFSI